MKRAITYLLFIVAFTAKAQLIPNFGGERAGLSALSFLKNDVSPISIGLAGATAAIDGDGYAIYHNPAGMFELKSTSLSLSNSFIGAGINQAFFSGIFPLKNKTSALGISINGLSSGAIEERTEFQPTGTGRYVYATNLAAGLSYSIQLSEQFSLGTTIKYVYENLAEYSNHTMALDVGFLYKTDVRNLQFAVLLRNFGGSSSLSGSYLASSYNRSSSTQLENNTLPNVFSISASITIWEKEHHHILGAFQLNHPNDNAENYRLGIEYSYLKLIYARTGIKLNIKGQSYPSLGMSVRTRLGGHSLYIDYGSTPTDYLGWQHVLGLRFQFNNDTRE